MLAERAHHRLEVLALVVGGQADGRAHARIIAVVATTLPRNADVAEQLELLADLLEIEGEAAFRVLAYRRAASRVRDTGGPVAQLALDGEAKKLPGIGATIEEKIVQIVNTGEIEALSRRRKKIPPEVVDFLQIPGLGPKTVRKIWQELDVTTLADLKEAARSQRLRTLPGLGREGRGEHPQVGRAEEEGDRAAADPAGPGAPRAARGRRGAARAPGGRSGVRGRQRAPPQGDRPRPRHHRDGERPEGADRLLHEADLGLGGGREGADEGDGRLARGLPLRPARRAAGVLRQPAPALHRLEGPQRRAARGRCAPRALGLRVRRHRGRERRGDHRGRRGAGLRTARLRVHPAGAARERGRARGRAQGRAAGARRAGRAARRPAHALALVGRRQEHARRDGRGRESARLRLLRDHRPLALPARGPDERAGARDRQARQEGRAAAPAEGRRGEHQGRRDAGRGRRGARRARLGGRVDPHGLRPLADRAASSRRWRTRTST